MLVLDMRPYIEERGEAFYTFINILLVANDAVYLGGA